MTITTLKTPTFAIFSQCSDGMNWLANAATLEEATAMLDAGDFDHYDFVMVVPVLAFRDVDGGREG